MRSIFALFMLVAILTGPGCGQKKPEAVRTVEDAAAEKAKKIENFANDRLNIDKQ
jgi:hypothetical protein